MRLLSLAMGAVTIAALGAAVSTLTGNRRLGLLCAALTAFLPGFIFMAALVSNDNLAAMLAALLCWRIALLLRPVEYTHGLSERARLSLRGGDHASVRCRGFPPTTTTTTLRYSVGVRCCTGVRRPRLGAVPRFAEEQSHAQQAETASQKALAVTAPTLSGCTPRQAAVCRNQQVLTMAQITLGNGITITQFKREHELL